MRPLLLKSSLCLLFSTASCLANSTASTNLTIQPTSNNISWSPCFGNKNIECGSFTVPLDYANASTGNATLAVIRYKSVKNPRLGTIWTNPGGPGNSGIEVVAAGYGEFISNVTGGFFDIASWDPRGVNNSTPRVKCFESAAEETVFWNGTIPVSGIQVKGNFSDQADLDALYGQADKLDGLLVQLGQRCTQLSGDGLKYVGTTATVRDLLALAEAVDGSGTVVNYWGFSYGSVLGNYFINMFPNRVGRIILDGIVSPAAWANTPVYKSWDITLHDTNKTLQAFSDLCVAAGPNACAIASNGQSGAAIFQWILNLLDRAYDSYKAGGPISSSSIKDSIGGAMYDPRTWGDLAQYLQETSVNIASVPNTTSNPANSRSVPGVNGLSIGLSPFPPVNPHRASERRDTTSVDAPPDYGFQAISCSDAMDANYTMKNAFDELVNNTREASQIFAPRWSPVSLGCHRWPVRATERLTGPWNSTLANPILVIGNAADPVTPLINAQWVAGQLGKSAVLLEHDGPGHTSLTVHSDCTIQAAATYFITGKLPSSSGQKCATNEQLFLPQLNILPYTNFVDSITAVPETRFNAGKQSKNASNNGMLAKHPDVLLRLAFGASMVYMILM